MQLTLWAARWGIPKEALIDLRNELGVFDGPTSAPGEGEIAVQTRVRLEASRKGVRLWRNNVGAGTLNNGSFLRWGLCNESEAMNKQIKSSDLIGIRPVLIREEHVGHVLGQFVAREIKAAGWVYRGTPREVAQLRFMELVLSMGGDAAFASSEGTL